MAEPVSQSTLSRVIKSERPARLVWLVMSFARLYPSTGNKTQVAVDWCGASHWNGPSFNDWQRYHLVKEEKMNQWHLVHLVFTTIRKRGALHMEGATLSMHRTVGNYWSGRNRWCVPSIRISWISTLIFENNLLCYLCISPLSITAPSISICPVNRPADK